MLPAWLRHAWLLTPANPPHRVQMCRGTLGGTNTCLRAPSLGSPSRRPSWTSTPWRQVAAAASFSAQASSRQARRPPAAAASAAGGGRVRASCSSRWPLKAMCPSCECRLFAARQCPVQVGPESAGAHPGPVCYRKNGYLAITGKPLHAARWQLGRAALHAFFFVCPWAVGHAILRGAAGMSAELARHALPSFLLILAQMPTLCWGASFPTSSHTSLGRGRMRRWMLRAPGQHPTGAAGTPPQDCPSHARSVLSHILTSVIECLPCCFRLSSTAGQPWKL